MGWLLKKRWRNSFFLFCLLFLSCGQDYVTGKKVYNFYPLAKDIAFGKEVMQQQLKEVRSKNKKLDEAADTLELQRLRRMALRIAAVSHIPDFPYEVHLADLPVVNAWCAPGGKIMFYTGLWDPKKGLVQKGNDNELAAVMAHEISHATARHVTKAISRAATLAMVGGVATSAIAGAGAPVQAHVFQQIFSQGMNIYLPSYSRKNESEADAIGLMYMAMAGYDPRAAVSFLERAAKAKKGDKTSVYDSHPASGERADNLKKLLPKAMEIYNAVGPSPR